MQVPLLRKAQISIEPMPALLGVGYILGYRVGAIMVGGGCFRGLRLFRSWPMWARG